jgi:hypothetical protein
MAPRRGVYFDGSTWLTDTHDAIQARGCNATMVIEYRPHVNCIQKRFAEALLWAMHSLGLCSAVVGDSALYVAEKLRTPPDFLTVYIACHHQMLSTDIHMLIQLHPTEVFSIGSVDFVLNRLFIEPGEVIVYTVRYEEQTLVRLQCVDTLIPCGPRSNLNFVRFLWMTFTYYCTNYAMLIFPLHTSGIHVVTTPR